VRARSFSSGIHQACGNVRRGNDRPAVQGTGIDNAMNKWVLAAILAAAAVFMYVSIIVNMA